MSKNKEGKPPKSDKIIIFEKKEILLVFVFTILVAIVSFSLGVKTGKDYTFKEAGMTQYEHDRVLSLKSTAEENLDELAKNVDSKKDKKIIDDTYRKLEEEFKKINKGVTTDLEKKGNNIVDNIDRFSPSYQPLKPRGNNLKGKYTIQLGSYQLKSDAVKFANGFRVRGYNPIITEVNLPRKGTWYRVSLGAFKGISEAKDYIHREESLFQGQNYIVSELN